MADLYVPQASRLLTVPAAPDTRGQIGTGNQAREDVLLGMLDPSSATSIENGQRAGNQNAGAALKASLAGHGGFTYTDNPDGTSKVAFDPSKQSEGDVNRQTVGNEKDRFAGGGYYSSYAQQSIASALVRLSEGERTVVNKYADQVGSYAKDAFDARGSVIHELAGLYGQDSQWLLANPPLGAPSDINPISAAPAAPAAGPGPVAPQAHPSVPSGHVLGSWKVKPSAQTLDAIKRNHPGVNIQTVRAGNGSWVVKAV